MSDLPDVLWGIHMPIQVGNDPIASNHVSIGWQRMGDLSLLEQSRSAFKERYSEVYPEAKAGAVPVQAGQLYRFVCEMKPGDGVIYPSKHDRHVNLGIVTGEYKLNDDPRIEEQSSSRGVRWIRSLPRTEFSQAALYEIGSAMTLFQVANNAEEFLAAFAGEVAIPDTDDAATEAVSEQVEENTDDYVLKRLKTAMSDYGFEQFVANLLTAMGYHARVTQKSGDGGVDVIAHKDELGFEPPIIKVQCKQTFSSIGQPDVQRLDGAVQHGEFGLFVTLGLYTAQARTYEQMKPNLRLIDGSGLADLIYQHYRSFTPSMQRQIPLKQIYVPGPMTAD